MVREAGFILLQQHLDGIYFVKILAIHIGLLCFLVMLVTAGYGGFPYHSTYVLIVFHIVSFLAFPIREKKWGKWHLQTLAASYVDQPLSKVKSYLVLCHSIGYTVQSESDHNAKLSCWRNWVESHEIAWSCRVACIAQEDGQGKALQHFSLVCKRHGFLWWKRLDVMVA